MSSENLPAPAAPVTLFGTVDPATAFRAAEGVANVLAGALKRRKLVTKISGREYVLVEGWTLLGSMLGVFAEVEWTRPTEAHDGWEARAVAHIMGGAIIGSAEAMCTRSETHWRGRDEYALRSMAQTRAIAKALRLPLGFIVELAGYSATPAEEIPYEPDEPPRTRRITRETQSSGEASLRDRIETARIDRGLDGGALLAIATEVGVTPEARATPEQLRKILAAIEALPSTQQEIEEGMGDEIAH